MSTGKNHFEPLYDRILIRRAKEVPKAAGVIEVPDAAKEPPLEGEVLAAGCGRLTDAGLVPLRVAKGDRVLFGKYAGTEITMGGEDLLIMREEEVLGVMKQTEH